MSKPKTWDEHNGCGSCKYESLAGDEQPCRSCYGCNIHNDADNWVSKEAPEQPSIKDSGERREFKSGAVRDMQEGKGRCDLMPLRQVARLMDDGVLETIAKYQRDNNFLSIESAIIQFCEKRGWSTAHAMLELSKHFEQGAIKYGERNWEKGLPESCYIDSAVRHYLKWLDGWTDEPHDRAVLWNLMCLWWTHENIEKEDEA